MRWIRRLRWGFRKGCRERFTQRTQGFFETLILFQPSSFTQNECFQERTQWEAALYITTISTSINFAAWRLCVNLFSCSVTLCDLSVSLKNNLSHHSRNTPSLQKINQYLIKLLRMRLHWAMPTILQQYVICIIKPIHHMIC